MALSSQQQIELTEKYSAHNYAPLPVVISRGEGVWAYDVEGHKYLDMLAAYGAAGFGHSHPELVRAASAQLQRLTIISRAFYNDQLGLFCEALAQLTATELVLPMNSGAEAVETAVKAARRWGYRVKGIQPGRAEIVCMSNNFHGRTITMTSASDCAPYREGYEPFTPGFRIARFGDIADFERKINDNTAAVLFEPIQGEGGILVPPPGYLPQLAALCAQHQVLMIADEVQSGLCRTGRLFACEHEGIKPDLYVLGKALSGGVVPLSAVAGRKAVLGLFTPGSHGSTFGGNSLACAVGLEVIKLIKSLNLEKRAHEVGSYFMEQLKTLIGPRVREVRGRGLMIGIDVDPGAGSAHDYAKRLLQLGILSKDTRRQTLRFTPPLIIEKPEIDWAMEHIRSAFQV